MSGHLLDRLGPHVSYGSDSTKSTVRTKEARQDSSPKLLQDKDKEVIAESSDQSFSFSTVHNKFGSPPPNEVQDFTEIFAKHVLKTFTKTELPRLSQRIEGTDQLVYCNILLLYGSILSDTTDLNFDKAELDWLEEMKNDPTEVDRLRWLAVRMVEEFITETTKGSAEVAEVVALASVLQRGSYRKLLSTFIKEFDEAILLDVDLLQGIVQLVQSASPGFLVADDLIKILSKIRVRLEDSHQQSTEHLYHLTLAVSKILDVMADHKVQHLDRVLEHEPLAAILSGLKGTSDPYLMYQACYSFQALQFVPDDETPLQAVLRHSIGVGNGMVKIMAVMKLDLGAVLEGLDQAQEDIGNMVSTGVTVYEGFSSLMESGRGALESSIEGFGSDQKRHWYAAVKAAYAFAQVGQLDDLQKFIDEAPCRRDPLFQWGICQLLGEIAIDPVWSVLERQQATRILGQLCKDDQGWGQDTNLKSWMLTIINRLGAASDEVINEVIGALLQDLNLSQTTTAPLHPYPLRARLQVPAASPLLVKVQNIQDVEYDLYRLRLQRLEEVKLSVYIPPMAKANLQARDDDLFPLMDKVQEFLASDRHVMLILGDSGSGKSTFNKRLESELLRAYSCGDPIPLFINLPAIDRPDQDMIAKQLTTYNFNNDQLLELKLYRQFVLICDGYDESQQLVNLHRTNMLNQPGQWQAKMIITCRSQYLGQDYRSRFMPHSPDHYASPRPELFQEAVITPFSKDQIQSYIDQYVPLEPRAWTTQDYISKLTVIPNLLDLVKNPFVLTLALEALPLVIEGKSDLSAIKVTRVQLYDTFAEHWLDVNRRRLESNTLSADDREVLEQLFEAGFTLMGLDYSTRLAAAIFNNQNGNPVIRYIHLKDKNTWRVEFFGPDPEIRLLRESSPLTRSGSLFRFLHRSMQEYFYSRTVFDPSCHVDKDEFLPHSEAADKVIRPLEVQSPLFKRSLLAEPAVIQFLCERVSQHPDFEKQLLSIIEQSKTDTTVATAAANAITILVRAGVPFNGADLRGIRIPGADLSNGQFDSARLHGADLTGVNFARSWLRQADFGNAQMEGVRFEELPYQNVVRNVFSCQYSPDGRMLAVGTLGGGLYIYETVAWTRLHRYKHSGPIASLAFSSDSQRLVLGSWDNMVTLWEISCEKTLFVFKGHTGFVHSVALSPCGKRIASASDDKTVRLWNAETGETLFVLEGHVAGVAHVKYSADGQRLLSVCLEGEIRVWNPETSKLIADQMTLRSYSYNSPLAFSADGEWCAFALDNDKDGHEKVQLLNMITREPALILDKTGPVCNIAFSPDGQRIILSGDDNTIRLWDVSSGVLVSSYSGHISEVRACTFSPDGRQLASGDRRGIVRLWEVSLNLSVFDSQRPSTPVKTVVYSPDGQSILSSRGGFTIHQWNSLTGISEPIPAEMAQDVYSFAFSSDGKWIATGVKGGAIRILSCKTYVVDRTLFGHTMGVVALAFSPCGRWLVSCSWDGTARLWDLQDTNDQQNITVGGSSENPCGSLKCCAFLVTGHQFVIGTWEFFVGVFDVRTGGGPSSSFEKRAGCNMKSLACSPDGRRVALVGDTSSIYLWDLHSTKPHHELKGHTGDIHCVAYSPCGKWILSGGADRMIRLWHLRAGEVDDWSCVVVVGGSSDALESLAWNPVVPMEFASGCWDGSIQVWRILSGVGDDGEGISVRMLWSHDVGRLAASDSMIKDAVGLSPTNRKLLVQRGAIDSSLSAE